MAAGEKERRAAMGDLYPKLLQRVRKACRRTGLYHSTDADDVLQDVCEVILRKWQTFHVENSLWGWIDTIIRNNLINAHRRRGRLLSIDQTQQFEEDERPQSIEPSSSPDPSHEDCVARVLDRLYAEGPPRAGSVRTIELIEFIVDCGTDTRALAEYLGCSESAAKERKRYALQKFSELCAEICEAEECAATL
jgi:RNA polymerase sigma factor (sigma-70 family)